MDKINVAEYIGDLCNGIQLFNLLVPVRNKRTMNIHPIHSTVTREKLVDNFPQIKFPSPLKKGDIVHINSL